ncbi:MAG: hypothetical protein COA97_12385 [Flavobacteriales bacterium]|nr:MAG: hypothetical protein COA97_12385 [Flavobacteriales bacterium]
MSVSKLTLSVSEQTIEQAKKYAKAKGRSLSDLIENYLQLLTSKTGDEEAALSPLTKSLKSSFKVPLDFDYKKELTNALLKKHQLK